MKIKNFDRERLKTGTVSFLKKWWCSLLLLPFVLYSLQQMYWTLRFNIFFAVTYEFPFPYGIVHFLLDHFDLIVHEAGHAFFGIFGSRFLGILGGSLFQLILPALILAYTWFNEYRAGVQLSLAYLGFAWMSVAGYAADAAGRQLPLIGGLPKEAHDWFNILNDLDLLRHHWNLAAVFVLVGAVCYLTALALPLLKRSYETAEIDLKL